MRYTYKFSREGIGYDVFRLISDTEAVLLVSGVSKLEALALINEMEGEKDT